MLNYWFDGRIFKSIERCVGKGKSKSDLWYSVGLKFHIDLCSTDATLKVYATFSNYPVIQLYYFEDYLKYEKAFDCYNIR